MDIHVEEHCIRKKGEATQQHQSSLGERIQSGESLITLTSLLSKDETEYLSRLASAAATTQRTNKSNNCTLDHTLQVCVVRMPTLAAASRENSRGRAPVAGLPETLSLFLEEILERALIFIDQEICPSLKETLFGKQKDGGVTSIAQLFLNNQLEYSRREPAVNVYSAPNGKFSMHKDCHALTLLVPLSDPILDFTGGGTAFWSQSSPTEGQHDPSLVMIPPAGTALLFGGCVSHKGLAIETGTRVVFVVSFSRLGSKDNSYQIS
ncbi:expressed unknown protein [Seminavis robusta]|uniref:Fe2OG dioxygenase domain-containing protein n=1 Tax=Seminavis robusta TaxID=568900 RepID=A0A9N8F0T5_9STRA|nr:expressed unknown protein [Seminavis robusta]|eukprot:Sro2255_g320940.1 n/a (265) ;mRNA; r:1608-2402